MAVPHLASGLGCFGVDPAQAIADTMHMHIDTDSNRLAKRGVEAEVRHLGSNAAQSHHVLECVWNVVVVLFVQDLGGFQNVSVVVSTASTPMWQSAVLQREHQWRPY
jgi:hypothetical protein